MFQCKRIPAFFLSLLILMATAIPLSAQDTPPIQPRYATIYQTECLLTTYSDGSASVSGWVDFMKGESCNITVKLERNGRVVKTWSGKSTNGYVEISKDVYNLSSGSYQAIMYITCGTDKDTVSSTIEEI